MPSTETERAATHKVCAHAHQVIKSTSSVAHSVSRHSRRSMFFNRLLISLTLGGIAMLVTATSVTAPGMWMPLAAGFCTGATVFYFT